MEGLFAISSDERFPCHEVLAYDQFTVQGKDNFQSFRKVDAIRLLEFWLDQWVSLDAMEDQGVITGYYPCPDPEELVEMHHTILSCSGFTPANTIKGVLCIRSYFGDQIAFFFRFMVHLCNSLIFLAVVGAMFYLARVTVLKADSCLQFTPQSFGLVPSFFFNWWSPNIQGSSRHLENRSGGICFALGSLHVASLQTAHCSSETDMGSHIRRGADRANQSWLGLWEQAGELRFLCKYLYGALHLPVCGSNLWRFGMAVSIGRVGPPLQLLIPDPRCCHHAFAEQFFSFHYSSSSFFCMHWAVSDAPSGVKIKSLYRLWIDMSYL